MVSGHTTTRTAQTTASPAIVQDYLDVLLGNVLPAEVPDTEPEPPATGAWSADQIREAPATLAAAPLLQEAVAGAPVVPDNMTIADDMSLQQPGPQLPSPQEPSRSSQPWADKPFASLLFDVMGLKLAAPLHDLGGIMPLADKLQPMAAQADWFMGLIRWNGRTIRVVDTARFVMPERVGSDQPVEYQSVVVLGDSHWALAVNNADQSVHLQPADIRWRKTSGKRPWLAGTVLERLCALLDVGVLVAMLDASDTAKQVKADLAKDN